MPRKKQISPKRLTRLQKIRLRIKNLVYLVYLVSLPENHYILITKSNPRQLLLTLLHKNIKETHPMLSNAHGQREVSMKIETWEELIKDTISYTVDY